MFLIMLPSNISVIAHISVKLFPLHHSCTTVSHTSTEQRISSYAESYHALMKGETTARTLLRQSQVCLCVQLSTAQYTATVIHSFETFATMRAADLSLSWALMSGLVAGVRSALRSAWKRQETKATTCAASSSLSRPSNINSVTNNCTAKVCVLD